MNILFLNSIDENIYGGMEEWIRLAANGLAERGHNVYVAGRENSEFLSRLGNDNNSLNFIGLNISGDFNPYTISQIKNLIKDKQISFVVCNFNKDVRLGGMAALWSGNVTVVWSVGLNITKDSFIHRHLTPRLIEAVITPSESLKEQIIKPGYIKKEQCRVIPISIPEVDYSHDECRKIILKKYNLTDNNIIAVTSGRFVEQKGHRYLIEAAPQIIKRHPDIRFLLLGDGHLKNDLQTRIEDSDLTKYFVFAGMLSDVNVELFGSDLMIHPSIEEPFGIAILEGMRAGLLIAASRIGGIPEVVREGTNAQLFTSKNGEEIAVTVNKILDDPATLERFGKESYKRWQEKFKYSIMIDKIESCFRELNAAKN